MAEGNADATVLPRHLDGQSADVDVADHIPLIRSITLVRSISTIISLITCIALITTSLIVSLVVIVVWSISATAEKIEGVYDRNSSVLAVPVVTVVGSVLVLGIDEPVDRTADERSKAVVVVVVVLSAVGVWLSEIW